VYGKTGVINGSAADVAVKFPADWKQLSTRHAGGLIPDINGDGAADFMAAEISSPFGPGRVIVFW
jgi:hypothetical protein